MNIPEAELKEAGLAQFLSAAQTLDCLEDPTIPSEHQVMAATVFILSSQLIKEADPTKPSLEAVVTDTLETLGADEEVAASFAQKHTTHRGADRLCQALHETNPKAPGIIRIKHGWDFQPQKFFRGYLDNYRPLR